VTFKTKPELALDLIERADGFPTAWALPTAPTATIPSLSHLMTRGTHDDAER
jgi:hypothetical protein